MTIVETSSNQGVSHKILFPRSITIYVCQLLCAPSLSYISQLRQQLAWMADFVKSQQHCLQTILHNFSAAQHGKGPADFESGRLLYALRIA